MMNRKLAEVLATFFYVGRFPMAPGSMATAVGLLLAWALHFWTIFYIIVLLVVTGVGILASSIEEKSAGKKDPGHIVIDEVAGILLAFLFVPLTWPTMICGFFLFRAFDMFKISPADRFERMGGGFGIMADDLMAGLYTNLVLQAALILVYHI